jgi:hypothetical protein
VLDVRAGLAAFRLVLAMNCKEARTLGVLSTKGNPDAMKNVKELLNSLVVVDMQTVKIREINLQAGHAKTETQVVLRSFVHVRFCFLCTEMRCSVTNHETLQ